MLLINLATNQILTQEWISMLEHGILNHMAHGGGPTKIQHLLSLVQK